MRFFICLITLILSGCVTIPPQDTIVTTSSCLPRTPTSITPFQKPMSYITETHRPQQITDQYHYVWSCMVNYGWGRGWVDKQNFNN